MSNVLMYQYKCKIFILYILPRPIDFTGSEGLRWNRRKDEKQPGGHMKKAAMYAIVGLILGNISLATFPGPGEVTLVQIPGEHVIVPGEHIVPLRDLKI